MTNLPPSAPPDNAIDAEHLRLLVVFHFVGAGLAALALCFLAVHFLLFREFFANPAMWMNQRVAPPPPAELFSLFRWFYAFFGTMLLASGLVNVLSAVFIRQRKNRTFSLIVAGLDCIHIPLGTVLGVFTFIILLRPSVQRLYDARSGTAPGPLASP
jgi:heme/copper-type cytochrome/quinol oxidase subunit 3